MSEVTEIVKNMDHELKTCYKGRNFEEFFLNSYRCYCGGISKALEAFEILGITRQKNQ